MKVQSTDYPVHSKFSVSIEHDMMGRERRMRRGKKNRRKKVKREEAGIQALP